MERSPDYIGNAIFRADDITIDRIIKTILEYLFVSPPLTNRAAICSVSRRFRRLGEPILYRHVIPGLPDGGARCFLLLRTLLLRPELALHIYNFELNTDWQCLESALMYTGSHMPSDHPICSEGSTIGTAGPFTIWYRTSNSVLPFYLEFTAQEMQLLANLVPQTFDFRRRMVNYGMAEAAVGLVLVRCANLKVIDIRIDDYFCRRNGTDGFDSCCKLRFFLMLVGFSPSSFTANSHFNELESLEIGYAREETSISILAVESILCLFRLPALQKLRIQGLSGYIRRHSRFLISRPSSSIRSLNIFDSTVSLETVGEILQACPSMEQLTLRLRIQSNSVVDCGKFREPLLHLSRTLRSLVFDSNDPIIFLGRLDLTGFHRLSNIALPVSSRSFTRFDSRPHILPSSVRKIAAFFRYRPDLHGSIRHIAGFRDKLRGSDRHFAVDRSICNRFQFRSLTNLRELHIFCIVEGLASEEECTVSDFTHVRLACQREGVALYAANLDWRSQPYSAETDAFKLD